MHKPKARHKFWIAFEEKVALNIVLFVLANARNQHSTVDACEGCVQRLLVFEIAFHNCHNRKIAEHLLRLLDIAGHS